MNKAFQLLFIDHRSGRHRMRRACTCDVHAWRARTCKYLPAHARPARPRDHVTARDIKRCRCAGRYCRRRTRTRSLPVAFPIAVERRKKRRDDEEETRRPPRGKYRRSEETRRVDFGRASLPRAHRAASRDPRVSQSRKIAEAASRVGLSSRARTSRDSDGIVETIPALPRPRAGDHGTRVLVRPIDASRCRSGQDERVQILLGSQFRGPQLPAELRAEPDAKMGSKDEWDYFRNGKERKNVS